VVQEAFIRAYQHWKDFDVSKPLLPWLKTIAERVCIDHLRHRNCHPETLGSEGLEAATSSEGEPHREYEAGRERRAIALTLEAIPERQRRLIVGRDFEGRRYDELAAQEGLSLQALKSALWRARQAFRTQYDAVEAKVRAMLPPVGWRLRSLVKRGPEGVSPATGLLLQSVVDLVLAITVVAGTLGNAASPVIADTVSSQRPGPQHRGVAPAPQAGVPATDPSRSERGEPKLAAPRRSSTSVAVVQTPVRNPVTGEERAYGPRVWWEEDGRRSVLLGGVRAAHQAACDHSQDAVCPALPVPSGE
jgi:RNA polymerase sigma-70 factor (ECF subfamily)